MRYTLRDWRWKLAYWMWAPGSLVEAVIEARQSGRMGDLDDTDKFLARCELLPGFQDCDLPTVLRWGRALIVAPCGWMAAAIYPGWADDERALLEYWRKR